MIVAGFEFLEIAELLGDKQAKMVGPPGVEPGSTASEAVILSIVLWTR